ncbi:DNA-formamidopyrimidine glycosylase family protein [Qipengyuania atrilutea]|uniref:DNA-formamidopyrimidine glycosylase n=1 Tax=Qipengyuania atrilutea TaxID=2744473 RepID=A0A850H2S1_9SPHN|nr:DNA-formamidopyrimidine glycosylase family protein [Actirhodobacter atriluteus]NVD44198.1 DNA-formamidopyrimidine glycosylase [Actirhodobacter atriluteus]
MPELPESDQARRVIEEQCLNRTIESAELGSDTGYIDLPGDNERGRLIGRQFTETTRHGKYIFAGSKTGPWIVVHLGMSGKLVAFDAPDDPPDYTKFLIAFEGDRRLAFRCPRKLGSLTVIDDPESFIADKKLGPDALKITCEEFTEAIGSSRGAVKSALISQTKLAGVGNLWSDEVLYRTGILPDRDGTDLSEAKLAEMHGALQDILRQVLKVHAVYSELPNDWLIHGRKIGADCSLCSGSIVKQTIGGRSAYHCDTHQE